MILETGGISIWFQPILELQQNSKRLYAVECLARGPVGTNLESPKVLFEYVRRKREEVTVDFICLEQALKTGGSLPYKPNLSINIHASTVVRAPHLVQFLCLKCEEYNISPSRVTLELIVNNFFHLDSGFLRVIRELHELGVKIAIDDFGVGQANFFLCLECEPDYIKIDRLIIEGCGNDPRREAVLECSLEFADRIGARVIAEGVEEMSEIKVIQRVGIDLLQGFYFSPPLPREILIETNFLSECLESVV